jgi:cell division protein FtsQ
VRRATALALVRPGPDRFRLPLSTRRLLAAVGSGLACLGLLYVGARETPLFAVDEIEVTGAPPSVQAAVRATAEAIVGESLVALDGDDLMRRLEALPTIVSARYDRAFPHTLRITIEPERPLAVAVRRGSAWLVSERGRVMRRVLPSTPAHVPRMRAGVGERLALGALVGDSHLLAGLRVLRQLPSDFPARVRAARPQGGTVTLVLAGGIEVRLGEPVDVPLKLAASARVLSALSDSERSALAYIDVSLPERPVAGRLTLNSKVEG